MLRDPSHDFQGNTDPLYHKTNIVWIMNSKLSYIGKRFIAIGSPSLWSGCHHDFEWHPKHLLLDTNVLLGTQLSLATHIRYWTHTCYRTHTCYWTHTIYLTHICFPIYMNWKWSLIGNRIIAKNVHSVLRDPSYDFQGNTDPLYHKKNIVWIMNSKL